MTDQTFTEEEVNERIAKALAQGFTPPVEALYTHACLEWLITDGVTTETTAVRLAQVRQIHYQKVMDLLDEVDAQVARQKIIRGIHQPGLEI